MCKVDMVRAEMRIVDEICKMHNTDAGECAGMWETEEQHGAAQTFRWKAASPMPFAFSRAVSDCV